MGWWGAVGATANRAAPKANCIHSHPPFPPHTAVKKLCLRAESSFSFERHMFLRRPLSADTPVGRRPASRDPPCTIGGKMAKVGFILFSNDTVSDMGGRPRFFRSRPRVGRRPFKTATPRQTTTSHPTTPHTTHHQPTTIHHPPPTPFPPNPPTPRLPTRPLWNATSPVQQLEM